MKISLIYISILAGLILVGCVPLFSAKPSSMVLIEQDTYPLTDSQTLYLAKRLSNFSQKNGLLLERNGSPGDGSAFSLQMKNPQESTLLIVTSPFKSSEFVFGLYSRRSSPENVSIKRALFVEAVRIATAP